jgi:dihydroneopterin aldolase
MTTTALSNRIVLRALTLDVYLGWPEIEYIKQQRVSVDVSMLFTNGLMACTSDNLADTYCYDNLITVLQEKIANRTFRLLEYFGHEIYLILKQIITQATGISVRVTKFPAIAALTGGVMFSCGDDTGVW